MSQALPGLQPSTVAFCSKVIQVLLYTFVSVAVGIFEIILLDISLLCVCVYIDTVETAHV